MRPRSVEENSKTIVRIQSYCELDASLSEMAAGNGDGTGNGRAKGCMQPSLEKRICFFMCRALVAHFGS